MIVVSLIYSLWVTMYSRSESVVQKKRLVGKKTVRCEDLSKPRSLTNRSDSATLLWRGGRGAGAKGSMIQHLVYIGTYVYRYIGPYLHTSTTSKH